MDTDKPKLREQAKSLLLKGCYKMAAIKYQRLIDLGSEGFTQRQWSVIHLNQGICHQFLEQHQKALQLANRSLEIDSTYEKAYYRRIQILRDMNRFQAAIKSIPSWIQNKQIADMLKEIKDQYYGSLGLNELMEEMISGKDVDIMTLKESHIKFYQKLVQHLQSNESKQKWEQISSKIAKYYVLLKEKKQHKKCESFVNTLHLLIVKVHNNQKERLRVKSILQSFWTQFITRAEPFISQTIEKKDLEMKQEFKITKYAPLCNQTVLLLKKIIQSQCLPLDLFFDHCLQMASSMISQEGQPAFGQNIHQCIVHIVSVLQQAMCHDLLGWLKKSFILTDTLITLRLQFEPNIHFTVVNLQNLLYLRYQYTNQGMQNASKPLFQVGQEKIKQYIEGSLHSFFVIYTFEHFVHRLDRSMFKGTVTEIEEQLTLMKDLGTLKKRKDKIIQMQKQYQLIYTSIMLKIDLKHTATYIDLPSLLSHKHNRQTIYDQSLSDIIINTLLLLAISNKKNLIQVINHPHSITDIVQQFVSGNFTQQLESISIATSFIYITVVDIEQQQLQIYAKKMGVTLEQIQKARQLQKQSTDPRLKQQIDKKRNQFRQYVIKHWNQIITNMSIFLLKIKEEKSLIKWGKIMAELVKLDGSRFLHSKIIQVMLEVTKIQKQYSGQFFSRLCKNINTNLLKYQQIQSICNVLVYNLENAQHELTIFQSLLGLINLTSNSTNTIKIPIKSLQKCLFEQNQYIVHGALQLLNNVLIYKTKKQIQQLKELKDLIQKYCKFLREEITKEFQMPLTDYSHPSRIYSTIISVAIVMDLDNLQEFQDWKTSQKYLKRIKPPRGVTLFKMAMYMAMKKKLEGKWWDNFSRELDELSKTNRDYWIKLKQYMN